MVRPLTQVCMKSTVKVLHVLTRDAHSATGKNTFVASIGGQTYELEMEDGSTVKLYQEMSAKINRNGKEMTVKVKDLMPDDDFIEAIQDF